MDCKNLPLIAGVAVGSFVAGGFIIPKIFGKPKVIPRKYQRSQEDEYVLATSLKEHPILNELFEKTRKEVPAYGMLTDPVQVQFFQMLLKSINAKKCIEVGAFTGYNVLSTALTIPNDGVVYALDVSEEYVNYGKPYFKKANVEDKIKIVIDKASNTMDKLISEGHSGTFDFIYVDADKFNYEVYYEKALVLVRSGGIVALDNMLWQGIVYDASRAKNEEYLKIGDFLRGLAQKVHQDSRVEVSFLKIGDGVYLCRKV